MINKFFRGTHSSSEPFFAADLLCCVRRVCLSVFLVICITALAVLPKEAEAQTLGAWTNVKNSCDTNTSTQYPTLSGGTSTPPPGGGEYIGCVTGNLEEVFKIPATNLQIGQEYTIPLSVANFSQSSWTGSGYWEAALDLTFTYNGPYTGWSVTGGPYLQSSATMIDGASWTDFTVTFTATKTAHDIFFTPKAVAGTGIAYLSMGVGAAAIAVASDVTNVTSSTVDGHYKAGDNVSIQVTFDEAVSVTGTPTLTLDVGGAAQSASYSGGTGTTTLTFVYTAQAGDISADLDYQSTSALSLNGGTIVSTTGGSNAILSLPSPGAAGSLGANKAIVIDTTAPVATNAAISLSTGSGTNSAFIVGDTVTASWDTSGSDGDTNITTSLGNVTVDFSAFGGANNVAATLSGTTWNASYLIVANTSTSGSNLNVSVTATDEAGNFATGADTSNATVDASPPVVSAANISLSGASGTGGAFKIGDTVTAAWNNTAGGDNNSDIASVTIDFTAFGGGAAVAASESSGTWTATHTITAGAIDAANLNVLLTATETSGNATTAAGTNNATVDSQAPTVTDANISISGASGTGGAFKVGDTVTASWNNTAGGDNNADIAGVTVDFTQFGGGAAVAATNSSGTWTAAYTIISGGIDATNRNVSVSATDDAGNVTTTANTSNAVVDSEVPTVVLTSTATGPHSGVFTVTATFPEAVTGFVIGDVTVGNGTASNFAGAGTTYTFDVTPVADGAVTIDIAANVAVDGAGNGNTAANQLTVISDSTGPTVTLTSTATSPHSGPFTVTVTFSEAVTGFEIGDVTVGNGAASNFAGTGTTYTFDVAPAADGAVTIDIAANVAVDAAGNDNAAAGQLTVTADGTGPTVTLTSNANTPHSGPFTVTATFSETVTGFVIGDVTVGNGTASNFAGTGTTYTFDVTPAADGAVTIEVGAGVAQDSAGNGNMASNQLSVLTDSTPPTVVITGPENGVVSDFTVTFTFSENVTGFEASDVTVSNGSKGTFSGSNDVYTLAITNPTLGTIVSVSVDANQAFDAAGNGNEASNVFEVQAGSPASEFEKYQAEIRQVLVDEGERSLRSVLSANQSLVRGGRSRFVAAQREQAECSEDDTGSGNQETCNVGLITRNAVPFDIDGSFALNGTTLSTRGSFFEQTGNYEGTQRRLFFGDFDVQHDRDNGSSTATLTARVAWEQMTSDQTMLGYFIGGELAHSNIDGAFAGDQDRIGVTVGGYAVHQLADQVYFDGFLSYGIGRNNLDMANDVLALTSDYTTRTATAGAAVSGVYEYERYEFRPELAFSYGHTWIGRVGFTGRAYGLVDDTLSLDAGNVSIANLTLRPEIVWALDADTVAESRSQLSFAPRAICERSIATTRTENCGGGAAFGLSSTSEDGLSNAEFTVIMDRVGSSNRSSFAFNLEHRF